MVEDRKFINNKTQTHYRGIESAVLRAMTPDQLVVEQKRVEKDLRALRIALEKTPDWLSLAPNLRRYQNALYREKRRIGKELDARARALIAGTDTFPLGEAAL